MLKNIVVTILILVFILSGCAQIPLINPSPTPTSGIKGSVTQGPMCPGPVQVGVNTCPDQPYQAIITILDTNNAQVAQIQTDANGNFSIPLAPGTYILHPEAGTPLPRAADQSVEVNPGQFTLVTIMYDTGMR